jgi:transcription antitermination factor NusA-like protein
MHPNWITLSHWVKLNNSSCNKGDCFNPQYILVRNAKLAIERIIANEGNGPQRGIGVNTFNDLGMPGGSSVFEMIVPGDKVGLIIGKGGETIKQLQEATGAKMVIVQVIKLKPLTDQRKSFD